MSVTTMNKADIETLRHLGARVAEIAADPINDERRRLWKKLNALEAERPMLVTDTKYVLHELVPESTLACRDPWARGIERFLRDRIFYYEQIGDDMVIEPRVIYSTVLHSSNYGVAEVLHQGDDGHGHGSYTWDPPLKTLPDDLRLLHFRTHQIDHGATQQALERLAAVFDGIVPVVKRDRFVGSQGLTMDAIMLIGLETFLLAMYDQPDGLHALMAFLRDDHLHTLNWLEHEGLLSQNNEDEKSGTGGSSYTDLLPQPDLQPGQSWRMKDQWLWSESQETSSVSPEHFGEFIFPYQLAIMQHFGLISYGCCEPLDTRWHFIKDIPNLRRVSVTPWANREKLAEQIGKRYVYSWRQNPAYVSSAWDEEVIRADIRRTLEITRGMNVELVMRDVHTVMREPWRLGRWAQIARETIDDVYG